MGKMQNAGPFSSDLVAFSPFNLLCLFASLPNYKTKLEQRDAWFCSQISLCRCCQEEHGRSCCTDANQGLKTLLPLECSINLHICVHTGSQATAEDKTIIPSLSMS